MVVLHTCKNVEGSINNQVAKVLRRLGVIFSDAQGQLTPKSAGWNSAEILLKFKLIQAFMVVMLPARMKKIKSNMMALEC